MSNPLTIPKNSVDAILMVMCFILTPAGVAAADREHQQIMADLRIMQEQTQQLQALMHDLGEALNAMNSRIEDQTSLERKALADTRVQLDMITGDVRVVREKIDETNVRLGTITQELESVHDAISNRETTQQIPVITEPVVDPGAAPGVATTQVPTSSPNSRARPQQLFQQAYGDYTSGHYSLAVQGFQAYLDSFPNSPQAHEAQLYIGESLVWAKKDSEAIAAYNRVITNYSNSPSVPQAYFKRGAAQQRLGEAAQAQESYEIAIKQFPNSPAAVLAQQRLEALRASAR